MVCGLWFMVHGLWCIVFHRAAHTEPPLRNSPSMIHLRGCVSRIQNRGGGRSQTPHGTDLEIVEGGKARRGGGDRTGRRKPSGISPGTRVCLKERLCASLYLSTRDRTSLLLEESEPGVFNPSSWYLEHRNPHPPTGLHVL